MKAPARLALGTLGFLVSAAYWPGLSGASTAPRWVVIAIVPIAALFVSVLFYRKPVTLTVPHLLGGLFVGWMLLTGLWSEAPLDYQDAAWKLVFLGAAAVLAAQLEDLEPLYIGAGLGIWLSSLLAIGQWLGWRPIPEVETPSGLFVNRNFMAEAAVLVLLAALFNARRLWWLIPGLLPAVILAQARGAWLALAAGLAAMLWGRSRLMLCGALALLVIAAIAVGYHGDGLKAGNLDHRLALWTDALQGLTWSGHGLGSFYGIFPSIATHADALASRPEHAHNDALEILFEAGPIGLLLAAAFFGSLAGKLNAGRLIVIAFLTEGLVGFPLHMPTTAVLALFAAGQLAHHRVSVWDAAGYRGISARRWLEAAQSSGFARGVSSLYAGLHRFVDKLCGDVPVRSPLPDRPVATIVLPDRGYGRRSPDRDRSSEIRHQA